MAKPGTIKHLQHEVMYEVARLAFEGTLDEKAEYIPDTIVPGTLPHYRCCVYKEREIVRQRVRLAMGKSAGPKDDGNIIQVIEPACADCPISSYVVTDNCQNCVGKPCQSACRFGAISVGDKRSRIDPNKCKECGMCAKACPFNAIAHLERPCKSSCPVDALTYDENGLSVILEDKCIRCGQCITHCPFAAIRSKYWLVDVIEALKSEKEVYAMAAPSIEGQYGEGITMASWRKALKEVGFTDYVEVGLGADLTTSAEAVDWKEAHEKGEMRTTSCCPGFVNMIYRHYPELADKVSTAVSPMCQTSRLIKAEHPDAVTVFIGPCVAKKSEIIDQKIPGNADYAISFSEINAILRARGVTLEPMEEDYQRASVFGKMYAFAGGVADSCVEYLKEEGYQEDLSILKVCGGAECKKALKLASLGRLPEEFIEGMACDGGCFHGPSARDDSAKAVRDRKKMIARADKRTIHENLADYDLTKFSRYREKN